MHEAKPPLRAFDARESLKIILLPVGAAIVYGILHDQITIRVCPEYFTVAHPHIFNTNSLTLVAAGWGVVATWWAGAAAGAAFALAARFGALPKLTRRYYLRPVMVLGIAMAMLATLAGFTGCWLVSAGKIPILQAWGLPVPPDKWAAFTADLFAHLSSYLFGTIGSLIIALAAVRKRFALRRFSGAGW